MAAITAEYYGAEQTQVRAEGHAPIKPNELHGRQRIARFTLNTNTHGASGIADGSNVFVAKLPKGARILIGKLKFEAMGGTAALDVGLAAADGSGFIDAAGTVADDDDLFGAAIDVSGAGEAVFADTIAQNYGYELEKECYLVLTAETDNWADDKDLIGHIEYVVD